MAKDNKLKNAGVSGYNKPKRTPNHPTQSFGFVNESPRDVKEGVIKTPDFDTNNQDLDDNDKVINDLNNKIEEVDPRNKQE